MSERVKLAMVELETALATLEATFGKPRRDVGDPIDNPPALVLGPPIILYESGLPGPSGLQALVYVVERFDALANEKLWEHVELAASAVDDGTPGWVVRQASPTVYPSGGTDLPAYEIRVEAGLA